MRRYSKFARWTWAACLAALPVLPRASAAEIDPPLPTADGSTSSPQDGPIFRESSYLEAHTNHEAHVLDRTNMAALEYAAVAAPAAPKPAAKPKPPANPYKGVYFENDFKYLDDPKYKGPYFWGDSMKRVDLPCDSTLSAGGEYRMRFHNENELRDSALIGRSDTFLLQRTRLYMQVEHEGCRIYAEAIDAISDFEHFQARFIEENRFDALNLFAEAPVLKLDKSAVKFRGGRQEFLFGSERLVSPLDWANTRRTFDGFDLVHRGKDWNLDAFWTRPVTAVQHVNTDHNFDHSDSSQQFMGAFFTWKKKEGHVFDAYFLRFEEDAGPGTRVAPTYFDPMVFGGRWLGQKDDWRFEFEGGYQFGTWGTGTQAAGFATAGLGRVYNDIKTKPTAWIYYDYASGDQDPNDDVHQTFFQYFPLVHKYFGFADLVARQNIHDLNFQVSGQISPKWKYLMWYHIFWLDSARDSLYNAGGVPIRTDLTGNSGRYVGTELDLTATYTHDARTDVLFGYSRFWGGTFVNNTNPPGVGGDADFFYTQFSRRF